MTRALGIIALCILEFSITSAAHAGLNRSPSSWLGDLFGWDLSSTRQAVLNEALSHKGQPYIWNQSGPDSFDCSGFVYYVLKTALGSDRFPLSYDLSEIGNGYTAQSVYYRDQLHESGASIDCGNAQKADIIFFGSVSGSPNHIGFITDPSQRTFFGAQSRALGVTYESYADGTYWGSSRTPECYTNIWAN